MLLLIICSNVFAQRAEPLIWEYAGTKEFGDGRYSDILSDQKGYLWFSSFGGLNRYDGKKMFGFSPSSFPDPLILKMYEDFIGRIWLISYNGQLSYHENGEITPYPYNDSISHLVRRNHCSSIYIDSNHNVHLGLRQRGVLESI